MTCRELHRLEIMETVVSSVKRVPAKFAALGDSIAEKPGTLIVIPLVVAFVFGTDELEETSASLVVGGLCCFVKAVNALHDLVRGVESPRSAILRTALVTSGISRLASIGAIIYCGLSNDPSCIWMVPLLVTGERNFQV